MQCCRRTLKIHELVDRAKQVIRWHMLFEVELVEKRLLHHRPFAHHRLKSPSKETESGLYTASNSAFFNENGAHAPSEIW